MIVLQNESIVKYYLITIMEELELIYNTPNISALTYILCWKEKLDVPLFGQGRTGKCGYLQLI